MKQYHFQLKLPAERFLAYYRGEVRNIVVRAHTGQTVQFPASMLTRFITQTGVHGQFVLTCNDHNKCLSLERIES